MANKDKSSAPKPTTGPFGQYGFAQRTREGCVQGSADLEYGEIDGFRHGFTHTGHRHKESDLGKRVRGD